MYGSSRSGRENCTPMVTGSLGSLGVVAWVGPVVSSGPLEICRTISVFTSISSFFAADW